MKRFLPIRIHHIYYSYGWWWGRKFYFFDIIYGLNIVDMSREYHNAIYANNYRKIGGGRILSCDKTIQKECNENLY